MFLPKWETVPGKGDQILEEIRRANLAWLQLFRHEALLTARVDELRQTTDGRGDEIVQAAIPFGDLTDLHRLAQQFSSEDVDEILLSNVGQAVLRYSTSLQQKPRLLDRDRLRLTALRDGVVGHKKTGWAIQNFTEAAFADSSRLAEGDVIEAMFDGVYARPPLGGVATLTRWHTHYIHNLVNPATGEAFVDLEVLTRR